VLRGPSTAKQSGDGEAAGKSEGSSQPAKKTLDLSYIAADFNTAAIVHPSRLLNSPLLADWSKEPMVAGMIKDTGIDPRKIDQLILLGDPMPGGNVALMPAGIVRWSEDVDSKDLLSRQLNGVETAEFQGKQYYRGKKELAKVPVAGYVPEPRTLVVADKLTLEKMLAARDAKSPLLDRLAKVDLDHDLIFVFLLDQVPTSEPKPTVRQVAHEVLKKAEKDLPGVEKLADQVKAITVSLDLAGDTLLRIEVEATDAASATAVHDLVQKSIGMANQAYQGFKPALQAQAPPDLGQSVAELGDQLLGGLDLSKDGNRVVLVLKMPKGLPGVAAKLKPFLKDLAAPQPPPARKGPPGRLEKKSGPPGKK
jgi:hypothetical protein